MEKERFFELVYAWKGGDLTGDELYKRVFSLSDSDLWFDANLRCLLGGEIALIKKGKQQKIDRQKLANWILNYV